MIKILLQFFLNILNKASNSLNKASNSLEATINGIGRDVNVQLNLQTSTYDSTGRFYTFVLDNNDSLEGEALFTAIYNSLYNNKTFLEFGSIKAVFSTGIGNESEFNLHRNVLVDNNSSLHDYLSVVLTDNKKSFSWEWSYDNTIVHTVHIRVWNLDNNLNKKY